MEQTTRRRINLATAERLKSLREFMELDDTVAKGKMGLMEYMGYDAALTYAISVLEKEENNE